MRSVSTSTAYAKYRENMTRWASFGVPPHFPRLNFSLRSLQVNMLLSTLPIHDYTKSTSAQERK